MNGITSVNPTEALTTSLANMNHCISPIDCLETDHSSLVQATELSTGKIGLDS